VLRRTGEHCSEYLLKNLELNNPINVLTTTKHNKSRFFNKLYNFQEILVIFAQVKFDAMIELLKCFEWLVTLVLASILLYIF